MRRRGLPQDILPNHIQFLLACVCDNFKPIAGHTSSPQRSASLSLPLIRRQFAKSCCVSGQPNCLPYFDVLPCRVTHCSVAHTSMPHWRTWWAFVLASGHSNAVPRALDDRLTECLASTGVDATYRRPIVAIQFVFVARLAERKPGCRMRPGPRPARSTRPPAKMRWRVRMEIRRDSGN